MVDLRINKPKINLRRRSKTTLDIQNINKIKRKINFFNKNDLSKIFYNFFVISMDKEIYRLNESKNVDYRILFS